MGARARGPVVVTVALLALAAMFAAGSDGLRPPDGLHLPGHEQRAGNESPPAEHHSQQSEGPTDRVSSHHRVNSNADGAIRSTLRVAFLALLVLACAVAAVAGLRIRIVRRRDRRRIRPSPASVRTGGPEDEEPGPLDDALERGLAELDSGSVRNAVVAAWIHLEEYAERAGVERHPEDTPTEFVARALAAHLDPDALAGLADLYREARFSRHPIGESHRSAARAHLTALIHRRPAVSR